MRELINLEARRAETDAAIAAKPADWTAALVWSWCRKVATALRNEIRAGAAK